MMMRVRMLVVCIGRGRIGEDCIGVGELSGVARLNIREFGVGEQLLLLLLLIAGRIEGGRKHVSRNMRLLLLLLLGVVVGLEQGAVLSGIRCVD